MVHFLPLFSHHPVFPSPRDLAAFSQIKQNLSRQQFQQAEVMEEQSLEDVASVSADNMA